MARRPLTTLIRHLRCAARPRASDGLNDAELLERFAQRHDEAAFEVLVWRHGPMVLNVCLRVLHREHEAEDAFQATFLALVRKAGTIGQGESVGGWLYKVAYRVALRARTSVPVRPLPEEPLRDPAAADPAAALLGRELGLVLDEEVNRLADKYRVAFELCHLQGQTIEAVARLLGCPPGTVGTRLARARQQLRRRLSRRGYFSTPTAGRPLQVLPAALVGSTVEAALMPTAHQAVAAGVISAHVADLTKGVLRAMYLTKWAPVIVVALGLTMFAGGILLAQRVQVSPARAPVVPRVPTFREPGKEAEDADVVLRWKFVKDRPFYQEVTTETVQTMKVMSNDVKQQQRQTFYFRWTPLRQDGDSWELEQRIEGVKLDLDIGGSKITFDSTGDSSAGSPLAEFYKSLIDSDLKVTLNREYKVTKVAGRDEFLKKSVEANPALRQVVQQVLSEDAVRLSAETPFAGLPRGPVRPGDSWISKHKLDMGPVGYQVTYRYTYEGPQGKLDRIKIKVEEMRFTSARNEAGGLRFTFVKSDLKATEGSGTLLFDRAKGHSVHLDLRLTVAGGMTVSIGGQNTSVDLSHTQRTTVKTTDTTPLKRAEPAVADKDREIDRLRRENERLRRQLQAVEEALRGERKPKE